MTRKSPHVDVAKITVYPPMGIGRKRVAYRASHGPFDATASTAKEARELVLRDMAFCDQWREGRVVRGRCALEPTGFESWCFTLRTHEPWRSSSMLFAAATGPQAFERVARDYDDHPDVQAFLVGEIST